MNVKTDLGGAGRRKGLKGGKTHNIRGIIRWGINPHWAKRVKRKGAHTILWYNKEVRTRGRAGCRAKKRQCRAVVWGCTFGKKDF